MDWINFNQFSFSISDSAIEKVTGNIAERSFLAAHTKGRIKAQAN